MLDNQNDQDSLYIASALLERGDLTGNCEDYKKALAFMQQIRPPLGQNSSVRNRFAEILLHYGELSLDDEKLSQGIDELQHIAAQDVEDGRVFSNLGYGFLLLSTLREKEKERLLSSGEKALIKACKLGEKSAYYHLACLYSLSGLSDQAGDYLLRALEHNALPKPVDLAKDKWLDTIRETEKYRKLLKGLQGLKGAGPWMR